MNGAKTTMQGVIEAIKQVPCFSLSRGKTPDGEAEVTFDVTLFAGAAILAFLASPEMENCIVTMRQCLDWMEDLRASGDAGFWDWSERCEYTRGRQALAKLDKLMKEVA
jgi:hypothetical protein